MNNKKKHIIATIIMGTFMFLVDILLSMDNWIFVIVASIGILISIFKMLDINKKNIEDKEYTAIYNIKVLCEG